MAYEGTIYTGGSPASINNHNRKYDNSQSGWEEMKLGVSITDLGTKFFTDYIPGGTGIGGTTYGGSSSEILEWVLKENTYYSLAIKDNSGSNNKCNVFLQWYPCTGLE